MPAIKHSELVEQGNPFKPSIDGIIALENQIKKSLGQIKSDAKQMHEALKSGGVDPKKEAANVNNLSESYKKQQALLKEVEKTKKQLLTENAKYVNLQREEAKSLEQARQKTQAKNKELRTEVKLEKTASDSLDRKRAKLAKLKQEYAAASGAVAGKMVPQIKRLTKEVSKAEQAIGVHSRGVGSYTQSIKRAALQIGGALGLTAGVYGLVRALKGAFGIIREFDQSIANLSAVTGKTKQQLAGLINSAKQLEITTKFTASEVLALQLEFGKLGFSTQEIIEVQEASLNLAAAWGIDLARAATLAGGTIRGFGLSTSETTRVLDILAKSTTISALSVDKLETALGIVAPVAKGARISIEETVAMLGVLSDANVDASTAGTSLRNIFLTLAGKGLTLNEALNKIHNSANPLNEAFLLFGKRGATAALVLADNIEKSDKYTESLKNANGELAIMAEKQLDTISGKITLLSSSYGALIKSVDDGKGAWSSLFSSIVSGLTNALNAWTKWNNRTSSSDKITLGHLRRIERETRKVSQELVIAKTNMENLKGTPLFETAQGNVEKLSSDLAKLNNEIDQTKAGLTEKGIDFSLPETPEDTAKKNELAQKIKEEEDSALMAAADLQEKREQAAKEHQQLLTAIEAEGLIATKELRAMSLDDFKVWLQAKRDAITEQKEWEKEQQTISDEIESFNRDLEIEADKEYTDLAIEFSNQRIAQANRENQEELKLQEQKREAWNITTGVIASNLEQGTLAQRAAVAAQKVLALQQWAIDQGIIQGSIAKGAAKTLSWGVPANIPLIIAFWAQVASIILPLISKVKFRKGGSGEVTEKGIILEGHSHEAGGTPLPLEGERGEYFGVINKTATKKYRKELPELFQSLNRMEYKGFGDNVADSLMVYENINSQIDPFNEKIYNVLKKEKETVVITGDRRLIIKGRHTLNLSA